MPLIVGQESELTGNITTLQWIGAREPKLVEQSLGYHSSRLAEGYCIALLKDDLTSADFQFDGTTLRSGGRLGNPASSTAADGARTRVHQGILDERGQGGYEELQKHALTSVLLKGDERIAKVLPMKPHSETLAPDLQYPPGAGGLQWKLIKPKKFLIPLFVDPSAFAHSTSFSLFIGPGAPYENRAKVMNYLRTA
jgi:hypothetical protein